MPIPWHSNSAGGDDLPIRLRLSHKGFILVAVLLTFELVLLGLLGFLLHRAEVAEVRALRCKTAIAQANSVLTLFYRTAGVLFTYSATVTTKYGEGDSTYGADLDAIKDQFGPEFQKLKDAVGNNPEEQRNLDELKPDLDKLMDILSRARTLVKQPYEFGSFKRITDVAQLVSSGRRLMKRLHALVDYQESALNAEPYSSEQAQAAVKICLAVGIVLNIGLALWLAAVVTRGLTRRVERLTENTMRLGAGHELTVEESGSDEIAQLDRRFHEMARDLHRAAQKESAIIENALDVICTIDQTGRFTKVSQACEALWGYKPDELLGMRLSALVPPEDAESIGQTIKEIANGKAQNSFESQIRCNDGSFLDMSWSARWYAPDSSFFCVAHDVSQRKEVERLRKEFVSMVSHDLRTPLTSVSSCLALIQAGIFGDINESGRELLTETDEEVDRLMLLVNGLLDIARMEAGKLELELEECQADDMIRRSISAVQGLARRKFITIRHDLHEADERIIYGDKSRLVQVLVNLLSNAVKFSPEHSEVMVQVIDTEENTEVRVCDRGPGIPENKQDLVFGRFETVGKKSEIIEGSGLGLPISKSIIDAHGGAIGIRNNPGGGTIFWFRLHKNKQSSQTLTPGLSCNTVC